METIIGRLYSFGRNVNDIRVTPFHVSINSSFRMCVYFVGCAKIFIHEIHDSNQNEKVSSELPKDLGCDTDEKYEEKIYKLKFVKSVVLPFPVYFIVNTGESLWAVSHECQSELKFCDLNEDKTHSSRDVFHIDSDDKPMDVDLPILPEKGLMFETDSEITKTTCKKNPICSVSQFSGALVFCRRNSLQNCWTIEILLRDKKLFEVFDVPFVTSPIDYGIITQNCSDSDVFEAADLCREDNHNPVLLCVEAEDEENFNGDCVLKKESFVSFFGSDVSSNVVILIGLPDGRILWSAIALNAYNGKSERHLLCNIEQPVSSIYIKKHKISGDSCDFIVIVGLYGKVMSLAPDTSYSSGIEELDPSFIVNIAHIPSPVDIFSVCDKGILHAASGGPLWVSNLSFEEADPSDKSQGKKITTNSQQLNLHGLVHVLHLDNGGLTICVASDGSMYAGGFFEEISKNLSVTEEEIPVLLKSIYHYGDQLQQLEILAQKQRKLFSAVAIAAKLKFQGERKVTIVCSVTEIEVQSKKFIIAVEFQNLNELCLDTELWHLSANISSASNPGVMSVNECIPFNKGKCSLNVEVDPEMLACNSFSLFPLLVEAGLLLSIPTEWQSLGCFQSVVSLMPIYVEIESVLVHELYMLKACKTTEHTDISIDSPEMKEYSGIKTTLAKIASTKASAAHFQSEMKIKSFVLPQKFSFLIFNSSVQSLLKTEGSCLVSEDADIAENFFRYLTRHSNLNLTSKDSLVCLNYPVSINVCSKETFICVTISSSSFPLLVGLKASIVEMLKPYHNYIHSQDANVCKASDKSISISSEILGTLQSISTKISKLLCQNTHEISPEDIAVYKKLRDSISSNLYLL